MRTPLVTSNHIVRARLPLLARPQLNLELPSFRTDTVNSAGARLLRFIQTYRQAPQQVQEDDTEDEDDEDDEFYPPYWGPVGNVVRAGDNWYPKVTEPQPAGVELIGSGEFGKARNRLGTPRNSNIYSRLRRVGLQPRSLSAAADLKHNLIPNTHGTTVAAYDSNIYVAQFSPGTSYGMPFSFRRNS
jgi:hypothetical protein